MNPQRAEVLALEALAWLAGRPHDIAQFLMRAGLAAEDLRKAVGERELQVAVLDFLLSEEMLLQDFCQGASLEPKRIWTARHLLESPPQ